MFRFFDLYRLAETLKSQYIILYKVMTGILYWTMDDVMYDRWYTRCLQNSDAAGPSPIEFRVRPVR